MGRNHPTTLKGRNGKEGRKHTGWAEGHNQQGRKVGRQVEAQGGGGVGVVR